MKTIIIKSSNHRHGGRLVKPGEAITVNDHTAGRLVNNDLAAWAPTPGPTPTEPKVKPAAAADKTGDKK